jgi:hypothetical protein
MEPRLRAASHRIAISKGIRIIAVTRRLRDGEQASL